MACLCVMVPNGNAAAVVTNYDPWPGGMCVDGEQTRRAWFLHG